MAIAGPSFADTLKTFVGTGALRPQEADSYMENFRFFDHQRPSISERFPHSWVAALDSQLHSSPSLKELEARMDGLPRGEYAYIEQVP